ncbi:hypothetical protein PV328_006046 [Microctonus aethiopoides]|uniref:Uncharacterized protein n=1 Tax=Microctonus aethiopoides TaxID=144406 RepID=A0AA39FNJ3_9HYME|nr:hypothetical protein PV328_006046 [Microctonus aethiopoides]
MNIFLSLFNFNILVFTNDCGIPYGSVSGMLKNYPGPLDRRDSTEMINQISYLPQNQQQYYQPSESRIIITPNLRASGIARRQRGPVQIYRLPGVVAPGVVGTFSQIANIHIHFIN